MASVEVEQATRARAAARTKPDPEVLLRISLPALPEQCRVARKLATQALAGWADDSDSMDIVLVVLAELFTNGLGHHKVLDDERVCVSLTANVGPACRWLAVSVTDGGSGSMRTRWTDESAEDGRGLSLVRGLGAKISDQVLDVGYRVTAWVGDTSELRGQVCRCDCVSWGHQDQAICTWTVRTKRRVPDSGPLGTEQLCAPCAKHIKEVDVWLRRQLERSR